MGITIWIDGDACPNMIKEIVFKAALRVKAKVRLVANSYHKIPANQLFTLDVVDRSFDAADHFILGEMQSGDLVITADIPFADELIKQKGFVVTPKGEELNARNIGDKLATRNLLSELRGGLLIQGGAPPPGDKEKRAFADAFDRVLTRAIRAASV